MDNKLTSKPTTNDSPNIKKGHREAIVHPPSIILPHANTDCGPRTLIMGSGQASAQVEVRDADSQNLLGTGKVRDNHYWGFSLTEDLKIGTHKIQARQTIDGQHSEWSDSISFTVTRQDVAAPLIERPTTPLPDPFNFSGTGLNGAIVHVIDVSTTDGRIIASATVQGNSWRTPVLPPLPSRTYYVSAIQTLGGIASDWSDLLTFEVKRRVRKS